MSTPCARPPRPARVVYTPYREWNPWALNSSASVFMTCQKHRVNCNPGLLCSALVTRRPCLPWLKVIFRDEMRASACRPYRVLETTARPGPVRQVITLVCVAQLCSVHSRRVRPARSTAGLFQNTSRLTALLRPIIRTKRPPTRVHAEYTG